MTGFEDCHDGKKRRRAKAEHAVENGPPEEKKARHSPNLESTSMPVEVYPILWSFLLDSSSSSESDSCLLDFESIASLMLVSRASKETFAACRGWWMYAQALKREAESKRELLYRYKERGIQIARQMPEIGTSEFYTWHVAMCLWSNERVGGLKTKEERFFRIEEELLPEASRLDVSYGGEGVTMDLDAHLQSVEYALGMLILVSTLTIVLATD